MAMALPMPTAMAMANFAFEGNINFSNDWLSKMTMNVWHQQCSPAWGKQSPSTSSSITLWSSSSSSLLCCPGSSAPLLHSGQQISKGKYVHCLLPLSVSLFARQPGRQTERLGAGGVDSWHAYTAALHFDLCAYWRFEVCWICTILSPQLSGQPSETDRLASRRSWQGWSLQQLFLLSLSLCTSPCVFECWKLTLKDFR